MHTRDIPIDQWQPFLDTFTRLHQGDQIGIECIGPGSTRRSEFHHRPLLGVVAVPDCGGSSCIEVIAGPQLHAQTRTIRDPSHLSVTERDDGYPLSLQITDNDGAVTLLRMESPIQSSKPPGNYLG